jgi:hypothetical protein
MPGRFTYLVFAVGVLSVGPAAAFAQEWDGPTPRDGACFYMDSNYRGRYFCVEADEDYSTIPSGANDKISSIRLFGDVRVTVYSDGRFRGDSRQFDTSVRNLDLEDFNDVISSLKVKANTYGGGWGSGGRSRENPDTIVRRAFQDILGRDPDPVGLRTYRSHIIDDGWTEQQVRQALRNSAEYREQNTMTWEKAEEIVRRAYLSTLRREPDPASRAYVEKVFRERWTQQDVERELRKSPEYRER